MSYLRITESERAAIIATRNPYGDRTKEQKSAQVAAFRAVKARLGLDPDRKIKIEIDAPGNPNYLVVIDSATGRPIIDPSAAPAARALEPKAAWPYPTGSSDLPPTVKVDEPVKAAPKQGAVPPGSGALLKVASITIEDALELLRAEGDMCTSFAATTSVVDGSVSIKDGRLFFVL